MKVTPRPTSKKQKPAQVLPPVRESEPAIDVSLEEGDGAAYSTAEEYKLGKVQRAVIVGPWVAGALMIGWASVHFGAFYPDRTARTCEMAGRIPYELMCTDPERCNTDYYLMTVATLHMNERLDTLCYPNMPEVPIRVPRRIVISDEFVDHSEEMRRDLFEKLNEDDDG